MSYGLRVWDASGNLTFDSNDATGGVCLGFYTVATGGSLFYFPDFTSGVVPFAIIAGGGSAPVSEGLTYDFVLGYLRVAFAGYAAGLTVAIFVK